MILYDYVLIVLLWIYTGNIKIIPQDNDEIIILNSEENKPKRVRFITNYLTIFYLLCYTTYSTTYGGCYDIAKRNLNEELKISLPTVMLTTLNKGIPIESVSKLIPFDPHDLLPPRYKNFYGIRFCGIHNDRPMFYGFDLFYQITGSGLDLERFLEFCFTNHLYIDWYNFQRTSKERGLWSYNTLVRKLSYPVMEIYGREYWEGLELRFKQYEVSLLQK